MTPSCMLTPFDVRYGLTSSLDPGMLEGSLFDCVDNTSHEYSITCVDGYSTNVLRFRSCTIPHFFLVSGLVVVLMSDFIEMVMTAGAFSWQSGWR